MAQIETPRSPEPVMRRPSADREEKRVTRGRYDPEKEQEQLDVNDPNQRGFLVTFALKADECVRLLLIFVTFPPDSWPASSPLFPGESTSEVANSALQKQ